MEYILPLEIWQLIVDLSNPISQIRFCQISKFANLNLCVTDLYNLETKLLTKLDNEIIKKYPFVKKLNAGDNRKITNVSHMKSLKVLDASGYNCGISDDGIIGLNLNILYGSNNSKITKKN